MSSFKLSRWAGLAFGIAGVCGFVVPSVAFADQEARFESMDTDGDGRISPDEHAAAASRMFEKMDANGDGKVTAAETAAHLRLTGKKAEKGEMSAVDKIKMMDTNADGVLSADEYAAGAQSMFEKMDTDHDGYLTRAEVKAGHEKYMHRKAASSGAVRPAD